eukprot:m.22337 g.22337  ORF g.22337 m.22337 type:complete len:470 (+) comp7389_c0_seq1:148-1557(+)
MGVPQKNGLSAANREAAEDCALRARHLLKQRTADSAIRSMRMLEKACRMDPSNMTYRDEYAVAKEMHATLAGNESTNNASYQDHSTASSDDSKQPSTATSQKKPESSEEQEKDEEVEGKKNEEEKSGVGEIVKSITDLILKVASYLLELFLSVWKNDRSKSQSSHGESDRDNGEPIGTQDSWRDQSRETNTPASSKRFGGPKAAVELPSDPNKAVKRLLQCNEHDFYGILGVAETASQAEIKKAFRFQSLKVHPDKHEARDKSRAEAAFKRLTLANETLTNPEQKKEYDDLLAREQFMNSKIASEMEAFLNDLREQQEMAKTRVRCDACEQFHPKHKIKRDPYEGRWCGACFKYHPAKEGDVWVETSHLGMKIHVMSRIDGDIVDVTEWGICHDLHKLEPNAHTVRVTLQNPGGKKKKHKPKKEAEIPDSVDDLLDLLLEREKGKAKGGKAAPASYGTKKGKGKTKKRR